jgi:CxxC motif-containing protein (DUF1111 family)
MPRFRLTPLTRRITVALAATGLIAVATAALPPAFVKRPKGAPPPPPPAAAAVVNAAALSGLSASELADFNAGQEEFMASETPEGGLGPVFNDRSCVACHSAGGVGGASNRRVTRFGRLVDGHFDDLAGRGGSLLQARAIDPAALEVVPPEANVVAQRLTTPLFGAGLIEAIPDIDIETNAARTQPDGIKGRINRVTDVTTGATRIGRFGWKAQQATLLAFAGDAYLNEMGITNRFFATENAPNGKLDVLARFDRVPDIEDPIDPATGKADIDHAADFMRLLAPPQPLRATAQTTAGSRVFERIQCVACHTPVMFTGASPIRALAHQPARLYSDLLLHNMGSLGDGIEQAGAKGSEMRTAPLWGLRLRPSLLHDGRARTVAEAVRAHDGEAAAARNRFNTLSPTDQQALVAFLQTL